MPIENRPKQYGDRFMPHRAARTSPRAFRILQVAFCILLAGCQMPDHETTWSDLPALPDPIGFAGPFAGVSGGAMLVAGGANFPDAPPWRGGTKTWHDRVFVLPDPRSQWIESDVKLPRPIGYGVSITTPNGMVCVGGSDARQHHAHVFRLAWSTAERRLQIADLPPLPRPVANACGARVRNTIYIAGGLAEPNAASTLRTFFALDLNAREPAWRSLPPWPGRPRMLAVAAADDASNAFYLFSGADLAPGPDGKPVRTYLKDAYRYTPESGWRRLADMPRPAVAAPSPAVVDLIDARLRIAIHGGDDGANVDFQPLDEHPGFPRTTLFYNLAFNNWREAGDWPVPSVTNPLVGWAGGRVAPSGEIRPGVRTPRIQVVR
jgi:N-acetylneuraminic acid mutarotase